MYAILLTRLAPELFLEVGATWCMVCREEGRGEQQPFHLLAGKKTDTACVRMHKSLWAMLRVAQKPVMKRAVFYHNIMIWGVTCCLQLPVFTVVTL